MENGQKGNDYERNGNVGNGEMGNGHVETATWEDTMRMTSVVCNVPVLSQNDSTYHHSVFAT